MIEINDADRRRAYQGGIGGPAMTKVIDRSYYLKRVDEEHARADGCPDAGTARIHRELARLYEDLLARDADRADPSSAH